MILQVDMSTTCLACVDLDSTRSAQNGKPHGWKMSFASSSKFAGVVRQFFSFQVIVTPDSTSRVLPVTDIDKELFADKSDFYVI